MLPVVVGTNPDRAEWLKDCLTSIRATTKHRRVFIHRTGGFEITALRAGIAKFDRFLFLQDSCEVLSPDFWDVIDNTDPTWLLGGPPMHLAVYDSFNLAAAIEDAPQVMSKQWALAWEGALATRLNLPTIWPEIHDGTGRYEDHHGRNNLVLEKPGMLRKWKGHWGQGGPDL